MSEDKNNKLQVRNSTVDFLVFTRDAHEEGIEVRVQNHDVWLTQKAIGQLFGVDRSVVAKHLKNIFESGELSVGSVCAKFAQTADDGKTYQYKFYSLAAIIAVGYRINSGRAMQFRQWATKVLDTFTKQGYVLDKSRLINGQIFDEDYFEHLISEIQEIRASERRFYQKITDIYATAVDYDLDSKITKDFFATVQNKMHYAVHGNTAAEVIVARADHTKEHMGLTSWRNAPNGKIVKADVSVAKNYLSIDEMQELNEIVTMYLDYATRQARRHMKELLPKLDYWKKYKNLDDGGKFEEFKQGLIKEINALNVEGMPKVEKLNALVGGYVNLEYRLPNGKIVKFLDDNATYLGNQIECEFGGERCFGIVANMDFILICTYEKDGENPELVIYKKR